VAGGIGGGGGSLLLLLFVWSFLQSPAALFSVIPVPLIAEAGVVTTCLWVVVVVVSPTGADAGSSIALPPAGASSFVPWTTPPGVVNVVLGPAGGF
jgi:hypothetical protein